MQQDHSMTSTKPYMIRAIHEWCSDNGLTPYLAVSVNATVDVPMEYVNDGEIVLNVSYDATSALQLGNEYIGFKARFGGKPRDIFVPVERVLAIYARENGQGMAFPLSDDLPLTDALVSQQPPTSDAEGSEASSREHGHSDKRVFQVVRSTAAVQSKEEDTTPPIFPPPGGGRPALKRVK